jgi:RHS repeat-associated protein
MWLAASSFAVPDGVLATLTTAQLSGKPHQGVPAKTLASPPGIGECNSTAAIGLRASLALNRLRQSERARYYGSALGRFTSPDWSARPEPVPYADLADPQSLNQYVYVRNNPLSHTDADGHDDTATSVLNLGQEISEAPDEVSKLLGGALILTGVALGANDPDIQKAVSSIGDFILNHPIDSPELQGYKTLSQMTDDAGQRGKQPGPTTDPLTGHEVGKFVGDDKGNVMIEPKGGKTVSAGKNGVDTHTVYPNGSNAQRLNPTGHANNPTPHGHGHLPGTGPGKSGQGPSLSPDGTVVKPNTPDAHWPIIWK